MLLRERVHDVHRRHSPSCAIQHIAPQGDKLNKNRCPVEDMHNNHRVIVSEFLCIIASAHIPYGGLYAQPCLLPDASVVFIPFLSKHMYCTLHVG